jgi:hypothetical protein
MSLTDESGKDYIHLSRQEGFGDCTQRGLNGANCRIEQPSAYSSLNLWKKRQGYGFSSTSVNTFPTCNWDQFAKTCAFNTDFFERGKKELKPGLFQAKYAVFYPERPIVTGIEYGTVKLTVIEKIAKHSDKKAIDLNIVLVGSKNIQDSHSESGRRNLNLLFTHVNNHFSQTQPGIKLGSIKSFEWTKEKQGDAFAQISIGKLGELFKKGSHIIPKDTGTQALNIFIVSNFVEGSIAGISGQINGPMLHGTESSGLAFASFNQLAQFNMNCPSVATQCTLEKQDAIFVDMATTITHEIGHFMGLFHTQERSGASNDELPDTPHCRLISNKGYILQESCRYDRSIHPVTGKSCNEVCKGYDGFNSFCPESPECEYNHVMWWTSKNFNPSLAQGDGNIFSLSSSIILNYSPFVQ